MAKRTVSFASITTAALADTTNLTDGAYCTVLQGGSSTQRTNVLEVMLGGQSASTSQPQIILLSRDSTIAVTIGAVTTVDSPNMASTAALAAPVLVGNFWSGTKPQRLTGAGGHILCFSFNAYGGAARWLAKDWEEVDMVGNTQPLGELSLSAFTGTTAGAIGGHMVYEPF
jgi:hypothetical protein